MSGVSESFFDLWTYLFILIVFTGAMLVTFIAPMNVPPGALAFPKYITILDELGRPEVVLIPINILWGGLINGGTYASCVSLTYYTVRRYRRRSSSTK